MRAVTLSEHLLLPLSFALPLALPLFLGRRWKRGLSRNGRALATQLGVSKPAKRANGQPCHVAHRLEHPNSRADWWKRCWRIGMQRRVCKRASVLFLHVSAPGHAGLRAIWRWGALTHGKRRRANPEHRDVGGRPCERVASCNFCAFSLASAFRACCSSISFCCLSC